MRYALSFATGGLLVREATVVAPVYVEHRDWVKTREIAVNKNLLQSRTHSTAVRRVREVIKRLSALSDCEVESLTEMTASERSHLLWVAICRRYDFIGQFAEEVLRERFLTLARTVSYEDYDSFYRAKAVWHDELGEITDSSYRKLRQVLFRMMVEAGLLTAKGTIEPVLFTARIARFLTQRSPSDIRFFPTRED